MSKTVTVELGQTLIDIAVQELGSAEGVIDILRANPTIEQADELTPGAILVIDSDSVNVTIGDWFESNTIKVANRQSFISPVNTESYYQLNYIINGYFE